MVKKSPIGQSALHNIHIDLGASMFEYNGWNIPSHYTSPEEELDQIQQYGGLSDISHYGKIIVHGNVEECIANGLSQEIKTDIGTSITLNFTEDSEIAQLTLSKLASDEALIISKPAQSHLVTQILNDSSELCAHAIDISSTLTGLQLVGPLSEELLSSIIEFDISSSNFIDLNCAQGSAAQIHATIIRKDIGHFPSYNIFVDRGYGAYMWDTLFDISQNHQVVPVGIHAISLLSK